MIRPAERVGDAVLAAVVDEHDTRVVDVDAALRAPLELWIGCRTSCQRPGIPVRPLHHPRDDMLEPAEDRNPLARLLRGPEALVRIDGHPAPATALTRHAGSLSLQDRLQSPKRNSPAAAGDLAGLGTPAGPLPQSIRRPGYRPEHMFPLRPSRAAAALLELADALLAPVPATDPPAAPPATLEREPWSPASELAAGAHPHRRALTTRRQRRLAPTKQPQPCLTPLTAAATTPQGRTSRSKHVQPLER
jgi:hypothetical protein